MVLVPAYTALFLLLFIALSVRTILMRRKHRIAVGTDACQPLLRAVRAHGNFAEYVPLTLLAVGMWETRGGPAGLIHLACLVLLAGRLSHAVGVSREREAFAFRTAGMASTFTAMSLTIGGLASSYL